MKIKTNELIGPALDWAVAKLLEEEDRKITILRPTGIGWIVERETECDSAPKFERFWPSRSWAQGGPIIERERIWVIERYKNVWDALKDVPYEKRWKGTLILTGRAYLEAAMRCYVASRLGDEVDVPDELLK